MKTIRVLVTLQKIPLKVKQLYDNNSFLPYTQHAIILNVLFINT